MSDLIVLKLREEEVLAVSSELLTSNSTVFNRLINELNQDELDMDDFENEAVAIFITSLDSKNTRFDGVIPALDLTESFQYDLFRNIHKMSVVFEVSWMIQRCRGYLERIIEGVVDKDPDHVLCLFEECRFIRQKWNASRYVNLLIQKMQGIGNDDFIRAYTKHFNQLSEDQVELMLQVAGTKTEVLLEVMKRSLEENGGFHKNTRYLIKNINLPLCLQQNSKLYHEIFELLAVLGMSFEDTTLVFKLHMQSTKSYFSRKEKDPQRTRFIEHMYYSTLSYTLPGEDFIDFTIKTALRDRTRVTSMFLPIDLIFSGALKEPEVLHDPDPIALVKKMEEVSQKHKCKRITPRYVDIILSNEMWDIGLGYLKYKSMLEQIRDSDIITSYNSCVDAVCDASQGQELKHPSSWEDITYPLTYKDFLSNSTEYRFPFLFKHPGISKCTEDGDCGFLLKITRDYRTYSAKIELCTEESEYRPSHLHFHDIISAEDMICYVVLVRNRADGSRIRFPVAMGYHGSRNRFPVAMGGCYRNAADSCDKDIVEHIGVCYDITNYLAFKPE